MVVPIGLLPLVNVTLDSDSPVQPDPKHPNPIPNPIYITGLYPDASCAFASILVYLRGDQYMCIVYGGFYSSI